MTIISPRFGAVVTNITESKKTGLTFSVALSEPDDQKNFPTLYNMGEKTLGFPMLSINSTYGVVSTGKQFTVIDRRTPDVFKDIFCMADELKVAVPDRAGGFKRFLKALKLDIFPPKPLRLEADNSPKRKIQKSLQALATRLVSDDNAPLQRYARDLEGKLGWDFPTKTPGEIRDIAKSQLDAFLLMIQAEGLKTLKDGLRTSQTYLVERRLQERGSLSRQALKQLSA